MSDLPINQGKPLSSFMKKLMNYSSIAGTIGTALFCIWAYQKGLFTSQEALSDYMQQAGVWGPPLFIFLQILQTVVPIIPGALTSVAGIYIYGMWIGNLYNYIGIIIGSIIAFYLARKYGQLFVKSMVSEKTYNRYIGWLNRGNKFDYFFTFMMAFPVAPDDFLCMLAGLTKMSYKRFILIILVCKPITLAAYTYGFTLLIDWVWSFLN